MSTETFEGFAVGALPWGPVDAWVGVSYDHAQVVDTGPYSGTKSIGGQSFGLAAVQYPTRLPADVTVSAWFWLGPELNSGGTPDLILFDLLASGDVPSAIFRFNDGTPNKDRFELESFGGESAWSTEVLTVSGWYKMSLTTAAGQVFGKVYDSGGGLFLEMGPVAIAHGGHTGWTFAVDCARTWADDITVLEVAAVSRADPNARARLFG